MERDEAISRASLTPLGRNQALWLGESLHGTAIDAIYASSSARTMKTASLIAQGIGTDALIQPTDAFKELYLGVWEGLALEEAKRQDPLQFQRFWEEPDAFRVEGSGRWKTGRWPSWASCCRCMPANPS
ncbi:histidine phosphatase family protein [Paenibacillus methanolicus]|uniref:Putative phosphoglycerate mutase n=1 Tax=Paenibacillus methanolicus TaxID=582686 RepID=A0A5S5CNB4_9BACL|nr:histidine phosphatase family protein [Paenibacillus methanolicus]TYP79848.1 putative phosphoglycerate mutase [Paenibacillus methanolicus]